MASKCFMKHRNYHLLNHHLAFINNSRNFCASTMFQTDNQSKTELSSSKMTELYQKSLQYRQIITRTNNSKLYYRLHETRKIYDCKNINELRHLYETMQSEITLIHQFDIYNAFMKRSLDLDKTATFHTQIFEQLKEKLLSDTSSNAKKEVVIGKLFNNAMIAAISTSLNTKNGISHMFQIYEEYKTLCNDDSNNWRSDLPFYPITITRLIANCTMTGSYGQCRQIIDDLFNIHPQTFDYNKSHQQKLWNSVLNFFGKTKDLVQMEKYFKLMTDEYEIKPDDVTFNIRINAFAKEKDFRFESVFKEYVHTFNKYPGQNVFAALLNGYSFCGDIISCFGVLQLLISKHECDKKSDLMLKSLPDLDFLIFVPIFKSLIMTKDAIECEHGWKLVNYLLKQMEDAKVEPNEIIFGIIFTLCGNAFFDEPSIEKLEFYYAEMTERYKLKPQHTQLKNILKAGLQYWDNLIDRCDEEGKRQSVMMEKYQFVEWWKEEMNKYDVMINNELKHILIGAKCITCL